MNVRLVFQSKGFEDLHSIDEKAASFLEIHFIHDITFVRRYDRLHEFRIKS